MSYWFSDVLQLAAVGHLRKSNRMSKEIFFDEGILEDG